jgi:hypothetical protein
MDIIAALIMGFLFGMAIGIVIERINKEKRF